MKDKQKEVKEEFHITFLGYKKSEVDALINALSDKIEVLTKDVCFLKKELKKNGEKEEKLLKPITRNSAQNKLQS
jgi:cell division septum initiation protein DivIVA